MKKLRYGFRVTLILLSAAIIYLSITVLIALFLMPTQTIFIQLVMFGNLVLTTLIMFPIINFIIPDYTRKPGRDIFVIATIGASFKWLSNALGGDISIVYLLLIIGMFLWIFERE